MTEEELNAAAEAKLKEEEAAKAAEDAKKADETKKADDSGKPSDSEAALLKDVMKQKEARKAAEAKAKELEAKFEGVDIDAYNAMVKERADSEAAKKKAEEEKLLAAGEFDKVKEQMVAQHSEELGKRDVEIEELKAQIKALGGTISDLTVGAGFNSSNFIQEETVYTPNAARRLYGDHFDVENGKVIGYDKPRGSADRAPLVGSDGEPVGFNDAIRRIIETDPDSDKIMLGKLKPGSGSNPGDGKGVETKAPPKTTREKLNDGVMNLLKGVDLSASDGIKLPSDLK